MSSADEMATDTDKLIKTPENYSALASSEVQHDDSVDHDLHHRRWYHRLFIYNPLSYFLPRRYGIATLAFLGFCNVYSLRVNLSVAIVSMTAERAKDGSKVFDWDSETQGLILSTFFYGYIITQIPGGWLSNKFGGKRVFGYGVFVSSLLCLTTPIVTTYGGERGLMAVRVLQGLAEGVVYPSIHAVWSKWSPIHERSRLATIAFSGSYVGTVIALPVSGILADLYGWQSIFYAFGVLALLWCLLWMTTVGETPSEDKRISEDEIDYITSSLGPPSPIRKKPLPWGKMMTSLPVWAISIAHFSENWGFYTLLTFLPRFMNDMFHMQLSQAGLLSALPYMLMAVVVQVAGFLADYFRVHYFSTTVVRKLFTCTAFICQTFFMICAAYVTSPGWAMACLTMSVGLGGFAWAGFSVNHLDIAPAHASILMGISNTFATIPGMVSPVLAGKMLHQGTTSTISEWRGIFSVSATIYLLGATLYGLLASGEQQKWAGPTASEAIMSGSIESE